ncbi:MAG: metallophosphoesterase [Halobacteriota archaeon]
MSGCPVLVISDTHFGFEDESEVRFQHFMTYLTDAVHSGRMVIKSRQELSSEIPRKALRKESLEAPHKIILLGDILDLLVSRDSNTVRPFWESFNPINSLISLNKELVYISGNHDAVVGNNYKGRKYPLKGNATLRVYLDQYPAKDPHGRWLGVQIGKSKYVFAHGHQFDFFFGNPSVMRFANFAGFSSAAAANLKWFRRLGAFAFALALGVVISAFLYNWLPSLLAQLIPMLEQHPLLSGFVLLGWWFFGAIAFLGVFWAFILAAQSWYNYSRHPGHTQGGRYEKLLPVRSRRSIRQIIGTLGFWWQKRKIDADVVVFGHTHDPEIYASKHASVKLLVNAGSWIVQRDLTHDTFVYIDESGPRLLQWKDRCRYVLQLDAIRCDR